MMEFTCDGWVRQGFGFYNPNHAAALICALLPFLWSAWFRWPGRKVRIPVLLGSVLLLAALAATFSRTALSCRVRKAGAPCWFCTATIGISSK